MTFSSFGRKGERNTGANVGSGAGIVRDKTGKVINFKTLLEGDGISIAEGADELTISLDMLDEDNMASNSDTQPPSQQSVVAYIAAQLAALASGMSPQGNYDASTDTPSLDTTPSGILLGYTYFVSVAGTFFSEDVEAGDTLIAKQDDPTTLAHWIILQNNQTPASIKAAYESNANTNELNDVAAAKLSILYTKGADIASASALTIGTDGDYFDVTGTTTINSINTLGVGYPIKLHFDGILTLTHHATDLILPTGADIATAAGDEAVFIEYASGDWRCVNYQRATGKPLVSGTLVEEVTPQLSAPLDGQGNDLNNMGVMFLTEQAAAETFIAGKGQIWVKNTTPCELWFTDDAGNDSQLDNQSSGGGGILVESATGTNNIGNESAGSFAAMTAGADKNTAVGKNTLAALTSGDYNTVFGAHAGLMITTGGNNVFVGRDTADNATTSTDCVIIGDNAYASSSGISNVVVIGSGAYCGGDNSVGLGRSVQVQSESVAIGRLAITAGSSAVSVGYDTYAHTAGIAIGRKAETSAANQMVIGGNGYEINNLRLGSSNADTTPQAEFLMEPSPASGSNVSGTDFAICAGNNTGSGTAGALLFQTGSAGASGSTAGTILDRMKITETGIFLYDLPTSDPSVTGQLYLSGGALMVSA